MTLTLLLEWLNLAANLAGLVLIPLVAWLLRRTRGLTTAVGKEDATTLAALGRIEAALYALLRVRSGAVPLKKRSPRHPQ